MPLDSCNEDSFAYAAYLTPRALDNHHHHQLRLAHHRLIRVTTLYTKSCLLLLFQLLPTHIYAPSVQLVAASVGRLAFSSSRRLLRLAVRPAVRLARWFYEYNRSRTRRDADLDSAPSAGLRGVTELLLCYHDGTWGSRTCSPVLHLRAAGLSTTHLHIFARLFAHQPRPQLACRRTTIPDQTNISSELLHPACSHLVSSLRRRHHHEIQQTRPRRARNTVRRHLGSSHQLLASDAWPCWGKAAYGCCSLPLALFASLPLYLPLPLTAPCLLGLSPVSFAGPFLILAPSSTV